MFESKSNAYFIAGLFLSALSFVVMVVLPCAMDIDQPQQTLLQIAAEGITHEFIDLAERYPEQFAAYFPDGPNTASYAEALKRGHNIFIAEGCGHCHTQQFRHVSNEDLRRGPVSHAREYRNVLQRPVLFGTRRVGPDLIGEAARRSNDWHIAHFYKPTLVSPTSVMPEYSWYFDDDGYPNKDGMSLITYIQWLGSGREEYPYFEGKGQEERSAEQTLNDANEMDGA